MKKTLDNFIELFRENNNKFENKQRKSRNRSKPKVSEETILRDINTSIKKSGCKRLSVGALFRVFGHKRRGSKNTGEINDFLLGHKLYCFPVLTRDISWNSRLAIYKFPVKCKGDLFDCESDLQKSLFEKKTLLSLGITSISPEYSPNYTRDRLDFFAGNEDENVVIEVKHKGGGKRAVEQVLRYAGMLKQQYPEKPIRKILITGKQDLHTAKAIHGMTNEERNEFEWHLYNYNKITGNLILEKVNYEKFSHFFIS